MYETPIRLTASDGKIARVLDDTITDLVNKMQSDCENYITYKVEQTLGCEVSKEELIKAMQYDRDQYDKGYQDGYLDGVRDGKQILLNKLQEFVEGE